MECPGLSRTSTGSTRTNGLLAAPRADSHRDSTASVSQTLEGHDQEPADHTTELLAGSQPSIQLYFVGRQENRRGYDEIVGLRRACISANAKEPATKLAIAEGSGTEITIRFGWTRVWDPLALVAVRLTVYVPGTVYW